MFAGKQERAMKWVRVLSAMLGARGATAGTMGDVMTIDAATQEEIDRLSEAVDGFVAEMKARLRE